MALRGTPPSTPKVSRGQISSPLVAPPGLDLPPGLPLLPSPALAMDHEETLEQIADSVREHTNAQVQLKADLMWQSTQQDLKLFDQQREDDNKTKEEELRRLREQVAYLEADRENMKRTVTMLQAQMNAMSAQFPPQFGSDPSRGFFSPAMSTPSPCAGGNFMSMGDPFGNFPSGFPMIPAFPLEGEQSQFDVPPLGVAKAPTSAPPTPSRAPVAPPAMAPPPPPTAECAAKASMPISISEAIADTTSLLGSPRKDKAPCNSDMEALRLMMQEDAAEKVPYQCLTPVRQSPGSSKTLSGTPSRTLQSSPNCKTNLLASPSKLMNVTPKRSTPRSTGKFAPGMKSPSIMASPFVICESGGYVFEFTLRLADDFVVGINVEHSDEKPSLKVTGIVPGGAMEAWNRQCTGGPSAGKEVMAGDYIVKVNKCDKPEGMLKECREQKLLRFTVTRGDIDTDVDPLGMADDSSCRRGNLPSIFASPKRTWGGNQDFSSP